MLLFLEEGLQGQYAVNKGLAESGSTITKSKIQSSHVGSATHGKLPLIIRICEPNVQHIPAKGGWEGDKYQTRDGALIEQDLSEAWGSNTCPLTYESAPLIPEPPIRLR